MTLSALLLPLLLQVGPNPTTGAIPDYSAEVQDRPPREVVQPVTARATPTWLEECFELVDSDPARAHSKAQIRRDESTGEERVLANHCFGLAATRLERWDEAQTAFIAARDGAPAEDRAFRARVGAMAGNAAMPTGDLVRAMALFDQAEVDARASMAKDMIALIDIDKARVLVALEREAEAEPLLEEASALIPASGEAPLLLATLYRRQDKLLEAAAAIAEAQAREPQSPAIGLEAGVIAILSDRESDARANWQSVIANDPESAEAELARGYLAQIAGR